MDAKKRLEGPFSYRAHPHLYEINTWAWLEELSAKHSRCLRLQDVPGEEWDHLADMGFDFVYLMGVWRRSLIGRRIFRTDPRNFPNFDAALPAWKMRDVVGSPFSIQEYSPDPRIATVEGLSEIHNQLRRRGMGLILDFVPNHTGFDHSWVAQHPDRYIQGSEEDFRRDPAAFYLVEREAVEREGDENLFVARGRDPYFPPWSDVAQLNNFNPGCRQGMIGILRNIAQHCDGVRCDMAMLVTNEIFYRTWGHFLQSWPVPRTEFWEEAIAAVPDFVWLAEVYWNMEWRMQELGFKFTYDKRLYDRLREGSTGQVRAHLGADIRYQSKLAHFLENHDEPRCAAVFPRERIVSVVTLLSTLPGMRFYHHGQLNGAKTFVPVSLARAQPETEDRQIRELYERLVRLAHADVFHSGEWQLLEVQPAGDDTFQDLIAYRWHYQSDNRLIVVNLGNRTAQGKVPKTAVGASRSYLFRDLLNGREYLRERAEIDSNGLYVRLS
ncbi:MAG: alpha-amylase family glycosyl hydrolase, partial [Terriglobales bacterium]